MSFAQQVYIIRGRGDSKEHEGSDSRSCSSAASGGGFLRILISRVLCLREMSRQSLPLARRECRKPS